ncbi:MAG TPA: EF-hand domain-containing protein [Gammaproteobacteria bacterium]|nr:EF-hand domain-containing protein [Gammaproteobacteria bacterium]
MWILLVPLACNVGCAAPTQHGHVAERPLGFQRLDLNQDGYLSRQEASAALELPELVRKADTDGDGRVSPGELRRFIHGEEALHQRSG